MQSRVSVLLCLTLVVALCASCSREEIPPPAWNGEIPVVSVLDGVADRLEAARRLCASGSLLGRHWMCLEVLFGEAIHEQGNSEVVRFLIADDGMDVFMLSARIDDEGRIRELTPPAIR